MNTVATVLTVIQTIMQMAPLAIEAIGDLNQFGEVLYTKISGGKPVTEEVRKELNDKIYEMHNEFQKSIPPENEQ